MDKYVKEKIKSRTAWLVAFILATVWFLATVLPFIYMVLNSFKGQFEMLKKGVFQLPDTWYPANYINEIGRAHV
jgi:raffinose/stachyose/melibiose transport system permease protein